MKEYEIVCLYCHSNPVIFNLLIAKKNFQCARYNAGCSVRTMNQGEKNGYPNTNKAKTKQVHHQDFELDSIIITFSQFFFDRWALHFCGSFWEIHYFVHTQNYRLFNCEWCGEIFCLFFVGMNILSVPLYAVNSIRRSYSTIDLFA